MIKKRGVYKYLSAAKQYVGESTWEKGKRLKENKLVRSKNGYDCFLILKDKMGSKIQKVKITKQVIEYGSKSDFPSFTNDVWSIDKTLGKKISFK